MSWVVHRFAGDLVARHRVAGCAHNPFLPMRCHRSENPSPEDLETSPARALEIIEVTHFLSLEFYLIRLKAERSVAEARYKARNRTYSAAKTCRWEISTIRLDNGRLPIIDRYQSITSKALVYLALVSLHFAYGDVKSNTRDSLEDAIFKPICAMESWRNFIWKGFGNTFGSKIVDCFVVVFLTDLFLFI